MIDLIPVQYRVAAGAIGVAVLVALLGLGAYIAYSHGESAADLRSQAKWDDQQTLQAKGLAAAATENRTEEQRRQTAVNQVMSDARKQQVAASNDGAGADAIGERVREQAGRLASNASCTAGDTGVAERGKAASRAAMVLSDLFQRVDKRAGELAKAYDSARIAGLACEMAYDGLRGGSAE
ncbi:MAG: hypothetical protein JWP42_2418 [Pseudomonas sp.]|nr:hypothetical protein [Pseudomonas sp.]